MVNAMLVVAGLALLLLGGGGLARGSGAGFHSYTLTVTGAGTSENPLVVTKSGDYVDRFEVDQNYVTTWTIVNSATVSIDAEVGEYSTCHISFSPPGDAQCRSRRTTVPQGQQKQVTATGALAPMTYLYTGPSEVRVAVTGGTLQKNDPDLEVERDFVFAELIAMLLGAISLFAWWWRRRR